MNLNRWDIPTLIVYGWHYQLFCQQRSETLINQSIILVEESVSMYKKRRLSRGWIDERNLCYLEAGLMKELFVTWLGIDETITGQRKERCLNRAWINQSINQSSKQASNQAINQSINQSIFVYLKLWYHNWHKNNWDLHASLKYSKAKFSECPAGTIFIEHKY